jgi:hypothetical protein
VSKTIKAGGWLIFPILACSIGAVEIIMSVSDPRLDSKLRRPNAWLVKFGNVVQLAQ